jgi:hypothetical protein
MDHYTDDDEALARAIAESEGSSYASAPDPAAHQSSVANCPRNHGLELFQASPAQRVMCDRCGKSLQAEESVWSCTQCNFDCCSNCYLLSGQSNRPVTVEGVPLSGNQLLPPSTNPGYTQSPSYNNPFSRPESVPTHMCLIPCTIGNIMVEMLVDTGAQTSVLSMPYVRQLGLANRLDRRTIGYAAGVGRARICGKINNVVCAFGEGHVEFPMDFIVLDVSDPLVIIGLDQLRKYKCLVDMEKEKLVFGGTGGVEVQMLPAEQQHFDVRTWNNAGCIVM